MREEALAEPRGFLGKIPDSAVLDEVQRASELLSYLQRIVDADKRPGRWIRTGSQHLVIAKFGLETRRLLDLRGSPGVHPAAFQRADSASRLSAR